MEHRYDEYKRVTEEHEVTNDWHMIHKTENNNKNKGQNKF